MIYDAARRSPPHVDDHRDMTVTGAVIYDAARRSPHHGMDSMRYLVACSDL